MPKLSHFAGFVVVTKFTPWVYMVTGIFEKKCQNLSKGMLTLSWWKYEHSYINTSPLSWFFTCRKAYIDRRKQCLLELGLPDCHRLTFESIFLAAVLLSQFIEFGCRQERQLEGLEHLFCPLRFLAIAASHSRVILKERKTKSSVQSWFKETNFRSKKNEGGKNQNCLALLWAVRRWNIPYQFSMTTCQGKWEDGKMGKWGGSG